MNSVWFLVLGLVIVSCSGLPSDPKGLQSLADQNENQREAFEKAYDNWGSGDVASSFTAYFDGRKLKFIEEHMTRGREGRSVNRFHFYGDALFCYRETRTLADSSVVQIEATFGRDGQMLSSSQSHGGASVMFDQYVPAMAKQHAETLRKMAKDAPRMQKR